MKIQTINNIKLNPCFYGENLIPDEKPLPPDTKGLVEYSHDYFLKQEKEHLSEAFLKDICDEDDSVLKNLGKSIKKTVKNLKK